MGKHSRKATDKSIGENNGLLLIRFLRVINRKTVPVQYIDQLSKMLKIKEVGRSMLRREDNRSTINSAAKRSEWILLYENLSVTEIASIDDKIRLFFPEFSCNINNTVSEIGETRNSNTQSTSLPQISQDTVPASVEQPAAIAQTMTVDNTDFVNQLQMVVQSYTPSTPGVDLQLSRDYLSDSTDDEENDILLAPVVERNVNNFQQFEPQNYDTDSTDDEDKENKMPVPIIEIKKEIDSERIGEQSASLVSNFFKISDSLQPCETSTDGISNVPMLSSTLNGKMSTENATFILNENNTALHKLAEKYSNKNMFNGDTIIAVAEKGCNISSNLHNFCEDVAINELDWLYETWLLSSGYGHAVFAHTIGDSQCFLGLTTYKCELTPKQYQLFEDTYRDYNLIIFPFFLCKKFGVCTVDCMSNVTELLFSAPRASLKLMYEDYTGKINKLITVVRANIENGNDEEIYGSMTAKTLKKSKYIPSPNSKLMQACQMKSLIETKLPMATENFDKSRIIEEIRRTIWRSCKEKQI